MKHRGYRRLLCIFLNECGWYYLTAYAEKSGLFSSPRCTSGQMQIRRLTSAHTCDSGLNHAPRAKICDTTTADLWRIHTGEHMFFLTNHHSSLYIIISFLEKFTHLLVSIGVIFYDLLEGEVIHSSQMFCQFFHINSHSYIAGKLLTLFTYVATLVWETSHE